MTRRTIIATAAFFVLSGPALADEVVEYDRAQLDDPAYLEQVREKIELAAKKECKSIYRGDWFADFRTRACIRDTVAVAMAELEDTQRTRLADAAH